MLDSLSDRLGDALGDLRSSGRLSEEDLDKSAHFFKATGCRKVAAADSGDLEDTEEVLMTLAEIEAAIRRGEFALTTQVAAFALATHPAFAK